MAQVPVAGVVVPKDATVSSRPDLFGVRGQFRPDGNGGLVTFVNADDTPEYATPEASQIDSGFYFGERGLPWHVSLARALNTPELMKDSGGLLTKEQALVAAGSFPVELDEVVARKTGLVIPGKFATVRGDTGAPLGVVGRGYKVFQEAELAELADKIVSTGGALKPAYETGGHMHGGAWFFLSMELSGLDIVVPGDPSPLETYLLLFTSHDGSRPAGYFLTQVRTVCKNTSDLAQKGALRTYRFRHTGSLAGKAAQASKALGIAVKNYAVVKQVTDQLALKKVVDSQVREILEKAVWPITAKEGDAEVERLSRHAQRAFALYEASPNLEGIRGTAWGAYNAVTEYLDHEVNYRGRKGSANEDIRASSILFDGSHDAKERTLKALLALA